MTTRIYLTPLALEIAKTVKEETRGGTREVTSLGGREIRIEGDDLEKYFQIYDEPFNPTFPLLPHFNSNYVARVTLLDTYYGVPRKDGVYRYRGGVAVVVTRWMRAGVENPEDARADQTISISAHTIRTLREIYIKVRNGTLAPTENFAAVRY